MFETEIWRKIEKGNELYQVSNLGRVKILHFGNQKFIKLLRDCKGHIYVALQKKDKLKNHKVHQLFAKIFISNLDDIRANYIPRDKKFGQAVLARKFNVSKILIINIVRSKTYSEIFLIQK